MPFRRCKWTCWHNGDVRFLVTLIIAASSFGQGIPAQNGSIEGTITDTGSAAPLLGLTVSATSVVSGVSNVVTTQTDAQGRYRLEGLPPGKYFLNVTGADISSSSSRDVTVPAGQDVKADFGLEIAARVSGRVTDWEKKPVANVSVVLVEGIYRKGTVIHEPAMAARTDGRGQYEIEMATPGRHYAVMAKPFHGSEARDSGSARRPCAARVRSRDNFPERKQIPGRGADHRIAIRAANGGYRYPIGAGTAVVCVGLAAAA